MTVVMLNRLLHHAEVLALQEESYCLRNERRAGLISKALSNGKKKERTGTPVETDNTARRCVNIRWLIRE